MSQISQLSSQAGTAAPMMTDTGGSQGEPVPMSKDYQARSWRFAFFNAVYVGGNAFKHGRDLNGQNVLIPHEAESAGLAEQVADFGAHGGVMPMVVTESGSQYVQRPINERPPGERYLRRQMCAYYVNHAAPIQDEVAAYLLGEAPSRPDALVLESGRLEWERRIAEVLAEAMRFGEAWIGWDSVAIPAEQAVSQAQAKELDPTHQGKPYLVSADPRAVLDYRESAGAVIWVAFLSTEPSAAPNEPDKKVVKVWTRTEWTKYEIRDSSGRQSMVKVASGAHTFGRCPWVRVVVPFPTEAIADLSKALYNFGSLLAEELYQCTFTQRVVTGASPDEARSMTTGQGNTIVIPNEGARYHVVGAIPDQAASIRQMCEDLVDSIYHMVKLTRNTKAVAESGYKRRLDMAGLQTMLGKIASVMERVENTLAVGMEILPVGSGASLPGVVYPREFDVESLDEALARAKEAVTLPFVPPETIKHLVRAALVKMSEVDEGDIEEMQRSLLPVDKDRAAAMVDLKAAGMMTAEDFCRLAGLPPGSAPLYASAFDMSHNSPEASNDPNKSTGANSGGNAPSNTPDENDDPEDSVPPGGSDIQAGGVGGTGQGS